MAYNLPSWSTFQSHGPKVALTLPPLSFFKFPPADIPRTLPPPSDHPTLAHPFTIPIDLYNAALSPNVPVLAALTYVTVISFLNGVNARRNYKPWAFSRTKLFKYMVITHNVILAVYSAWTFVGMVNALKTSLYPPWEEYGLAGTVDSLCKIHGPRGPGSAAVYEESTSAWGIANRFFHLGADGLAPESTDVGRMWNQGLAFYGWLFYLSKFYEVLDTLIIIAKGKRSSFLQTYHHAGAMLCMWAGIRYMSAPIWMFVFVNSFIHSIMYTFYFCSAIGVRVPVWFKRTLTTLQITQFVVGASYAFIHLFVKYEIPVSIPYTYHLGNVASSAALDASSVASSVLSTVTAIATDDWQALLRKAALRAAGREGLAENVYNRHGERFGVDATKAVQKWAARQETRYRDELQWIHCLSTSGQSFAVWLNVVYLLPLTWLFANFFIQSYLQRVERRRSSTASQKAQLAKESARDAAKRSGRRLSQAFEDSQAGVEDTGDEIAIIDKQKLKNNVKKASSKIKKEADKAAASARETLNNGASVVKQESSKLSSQASQKTEEIVTNAKQQSSNVTSKVEKEAEPVVADAKQGMANTLNDLQKQADSVKAKVEDVYQANLEYAKETLENVGTAISSTWRGKVEGEKGEDQTSTTDESNEVSKDNQGDDYEKAQTGTLESAEQGNEHQHDRKSVHTDGSADEGEPDSASTADTRPGNKPQELSTKEQVREQDPNSKAKTEVNTGDAKEDAAPADKPSEKDLGGEKSDQEKQPQQDTNLESAQGKDVASKEVGSKKRPVGDLVKDTMSSAQTKTSEAIETARDVLKESSKDKAGIDGRPDSRDYDDQKESWIHVDDGPTEAGATKDKADGNEGGSTEQTYADVLAGSESSADTTKQSQGDGESHLGPESSEVNPGKTANSVAQSESPEWFEKLTTGIDSSGSKPAGSISEDAKASTKANKTEEDPAPGSKQELDKIIDESEVIRDEPVDENTAEATPSNTTSATKNSKGTTSDGMSKKEQDKIIAESEPVRDEIKDPAADTKEEDDNVEAGA